jgi:hypothetical protein
MNFEQRIDLVRKWLIMDLARYERPANFTESHIKPEVEVMAEDINSEISTAYNQEGFKALLLRIGQNVRKTHKSRRWPVIAEYINAAKDCQANNHTQIEDRQPFKFDSDAIAAKRINAGEAVAETYINGSGAERLIEKKLITPNQLEPYKRYLRDERQKLYGNPEPVKHTEHEPEPDFMENPY